MHETTKLNIEKMNEKYRIAASKGRKEVKLEPSDLVWLQLRKERFPELRKSKLMSRAVGPFKILAKINDNAYKLELPPEFGVSHSFNILICDLTWEKKMRCNRGRCQCKRGRMMRTSILQLQSFLPLRYLSLSHDHEHNI
jgi:hypothetical protein